MEIFLATGYDSHLQLTPAKGLWYKVKHMSCVSDNISTTTGLFAVKFCIDTFVHILHELQEQAVAQSQLLIATI